MIPVTATDQNRADSHLWPKGTLCVVNGEALPLVQRKQQAHDSTKWTGTSAVYDLTEHISRPTENNEIKLLTDDSEAYYFCLSICKYWSPARLLKQFINSDPTSQTGFEKLNREQGAVKAKSFTQHATLMIDSDDDGPQEDNGGKFVFSITDPFSKTIIKKPVRGRQCKHYQVGREKHFHRSRSQRLFLTAGTLVYMLFLLLL